MYYILCLIYRPLMKMMTGSLFPMKVNCMSVHDGFCCHCARIGGWSECH